LKTPSIPAYYPPLAICAGDVASCLARTALRRGSQERGVIQRQQQNQENLVPEFDTIIKDGMVIDGQRTPWRYS